MGKWSRFVITVGLILIVMAVLFSFSTAGVFFNLKFGDGIVDYSTLNKDNLKKDQVVEGNVYAVIDCVAESYTERTSNGTTISETTDSYFYLMPFGDEDSNQVIFVEIPAGKPIEDQIDDLWEATYGGDDPDNLLEKGVAISGVVRNNDKDIMPLFTEWCEENEIDDIDLMPYTISCCADYNGICRNFYISLIFYALFIIYVVIIVLVFAKKRGGRSAGGYPQTDFAGADPYQNNVNNQYYNSNDMYQSNANSIPTFNSDSSNNGNNNMQ